MRFDAHGIGGASDLPIPAEYAIAGAVAALAVSFTVLALAWRTPRYADQNRGRSLPAPFVRVVDGAGWAIALRVLGLVVFGYVAWAATFGPDLQTNPVFGFVYVLLWVGLVPLSVLFGRFYRALSPLRTLNLLFARLVGGRDADPDEGVLDYPSWLGYWPATLGLFAFVWLELVYPSAIYLGPVRLWFATYLAINLVGGALFGARWFERADPFEAYSNLLARLSPWGRRDGHLVLRSPLANLDSTPVAPGLVGVVAVLFGSTGFDSFKESTLWLKFVQNQTVSATTLDFVALTAFCLLVGVLFVAATMATGVGEEVPRRRLPDRFAHSVIPIVAGYMVAHYLSYLVEAGQQTVIQLSDPMVDGSNLLGTADWQVGYWLSLHPTFLAVTKVAAVVTGHVLGVVAAHDRAISLLPRRHQLTGQLPLLAVMVAFTIGGLYLLFGS